RGQPRRRCPGGRRRPAGADPEIRRPGPRDRLLRTHRRAARPRSHRRPAHGCGGPARLSPAQQPLWRSRPRRVRAPVGDARGIPDPARRRARHGFRVALGRARIFAGATGRPRPRASGRDTSQPVAGFRRAGPGRTAGRAAGHPASCKEGDPMMNRRTLLASALTALVATPLLAHGPTPQQLSRSVKVAAPPEKVWALLADPASIAAWHPAIAEASMEGDGAGAKRSIAFKSGGILVDGIDDIGAETMTIRWRLSREDIEVFPVSFYTNSITVTPDGDGASVAWQASFFRADTTNEPEERFSAEAAVAAMEDRKSTRLNSSHVTSSYA